MKRKSLFISTLAAVVLLNPFAAGAVPVAPATLQQAAGALRLDRPVAYVRRGGAAPGPNMCWYYTDPSRKAGFWDACP